ncbi:MAG: hypothetical protein ABIC19_00030 [Patescibacteria group bacterium]|nr:hypothetical protein [Patescibacteria group bacterium]
MQITGQNYNDDNVSSGDDMDDRNLERRTKRIKRDNLLREYTGRRDNLESELKKYEQELGELENKVRFGEASISEKEKELAELREKIKRMEREYERDSFELRTNKDRMMKIDKEVEFLTRELEVVKKKLKKVEIQGED